MREVTQAQRGPIAVVLVCDRTLLGVDQRRVPQGRQPSRRGLVLGPFTLNLDQQHLLTMTGLTLKKKCTGGCPRSVHELGRKMMRSLQKLGPRCGLSILGLVTSVMCAAPARAGIISFETLSPAVHESGTSITEAGFQMLFIEGPMAASLGLVGITGAVIDSADPSSCEVIGCPQGASDNYLSILNDGAVQFTSSGLSGLFTLNSFNFTFVTPFPVLVGNHGRMVLNGVGQDGTTVSTSLAFPEQDVDGRFRFGAATLDSSFLGTRFSSLSFSACVFDLDGVCVNSVDSPAWNQAQFAIDDIDLTAVANAVPEPGSLLLAGLALTALGLTRRRHSARSTSL